MTTPTKESHDPRVLFSEQQSGHYATGTIAVDNPRTLNELLIQLADMKIAQELLIITNEQVEELLRLNGYDVQGLRPQERLYLQALTCMKGVGSLKTIADILDVEEVEVEQMVEPWLIRQGLIRKTSRGRQLVQVVGGN